MTKLWVVGLLVVGIVSTGEAQDPIRFDVQLLAVDANEGCDVADIDGDGKPDVVAGRNWYRNGDWVPRPLRNIDDWNGYVVSNGDFVYDVNQDGRPDVIAGGFIPSEVHWYENPGPEGLANGSLWAQHLLVDTQLSQNEASYLRDVDGDGVPEWISNSWKRDNPLIIWRFDGPSSDSRMSGHVVGKSANGHGIGFGDINNDGLEDILVGTGWYQRPSGDPFADEWTYHADWDRHLSCPVLVEDLDGDDRNDVIWGNPHDFGLYVWFGRGADDQGKLVFEEMEADRSYSQLHCLTLADLDGDGEQELITGKRVRAHNGGDPGGTEPPVVCYYKWNQRDRSFEQHVINRGEVGIGLQIRTADLDKDGDQDIVVAGKDGTQILWNKRL